MAVYRKKLVDKDGNTIIPAIGDIYGPVYTASLQSASGGIATYTFTPDTPVEANRVYAVKFPTPTVNNAVVLLGDGNMTARSIVLPPTYATNSPIYEVVYTSNLNNTEVWLLMYNGLGQWICINQKRPSYTVVDGTTSSSNPVNKAFKYDDGRLTCIQRYVFSNKNASSAWGNVYTGIAVSMSNYAVAFASLPVLTITGTSTSANFWLATRNEGGAPTTTKPQEMQLVRPTTSSGISGAINVIAEGFWK